MAINFILVQKDLEGCYQHTIIKHHLKKQGIEIKKYIQGEPPKETAVYSVVHEGDEVRLQSVSHLVNYLR